MSDVDTSSSTLLATHEIPIIDLSFKDSNSTATVQRTDEIAKELNDALSTKGMAFLINHGIAEEKIRSVFQLMETFCSLPESTRDKYRLNFPGEIQGYIPPGMERLIKDEKKTEFRHSYNVLRLTEKLPSDEKCNFKEVVGNVVEDFYNLAIFLLKMIAKALEIEPEVVMDLHKGMLKEGNLSIFRMLYYPPIEEEPSSTITRCVEHSDWGTFTLLTQELEGGLEVCTDGAHEWSNSRNFRTLDTQCLSSFARFRNYFSQHSLSSAIYLGRVIIQGNEPDLPPPPTPNVSLVLTDDK